MNNLLRAIFPPAHRHPQKYWSEFSSVLNDWDPMHRPFEFGEEGVIRRINLSAETVKSNGLVLDVADGLLKVEVN